MANPIALILVAAAALTSTTLIAPAPGLAGESWTTVNHNRMPLVHGSGRVIQQRRSVASFDRVHTNGAETVEVRIGARPSLVIAADDNILPLLSTEVRNGVLRIESRGSYRIRGPIRVWITTPDLRAFQTMGSGDVTIHGVNNDRLELTIHGSGDMQASGRTRDLDVDIYGSGNARLTSLAAQNADVDIYGSGNAAVSVRGSLGARVMGSGNIRYVGRPASLRARQFGSGTVAAGN
jgi:hypothetical protein